MKKKALLLSVLAAAVAVFFYSGWRYIDIQQEYRSGENSYLELEQFVSIDASEGENPASTKETVASAGGMLSKDTVSVSNPEDDTIWPVVDFDALRMINEDIIGWIYIEGTPINYPVVQGDDNDYYMKRLFDGSRNSSGCIFLDSRNAADFTDKNSILYGHHMNNGTMFHELDGYKKQDFYEAHPTALLLTPESDYKLELFTAYVTDVYADAWQIDFSNTDYSAWLKGIAEKSGFTTNVVPEEGDRVVTLSTCDYEFSDARFVVAGVLRARK